MKRLSCMLVLIILPATLAYSQWEQMEEGKGYSFFSVKDLSRVTIQSDSGTVAVFEVKSGVIIGVEYDAERNSRGVSPRIFRGDITVGLRRSDEIGPLPEKGILAMKIMADAPVQMKLKNCTLKIEELSGR